MAEVLFKQLEGARHAINVGGSLHLTYLLLACLPDNPFSLSDWQQWARLFPTLPRKAQAVARTLGITEVPSQLSAVKMLCCLRRMCVRSICSGSTGFCKGPPHISLSALPPSLPSLSLSLRCLREVHIACGTPGTQN